MLSHTTLASTMNIASHMLQNLRYQVCVYILKSCCQWNTFKLALYVKRFDSINLLYHIQKKMHELILYHIKRNSWCSQRYGLYRYQRTFWSCSNRSSLKFESHWNLIEFSRMFRKIFLPMHHSMHKFHFIVFITIIFVALFRQCLS